MLFSLCMRPSVLPCFVVILCPRYAGALCGGGENVYLNGSTSFTNNSATWLGGEKYCGFVLLL